MTRQKQTEKTDKELSEIERAVARLSKKHRSHVRAHIKKLYEGEVQEPTEFKGIGDRCKESS